MLTDRFGARLGATALCTALCLLASGPAVARTIVAFGVTGASQTNPVAINSSGTSVGTYIMSGGFMTQGFQRTSDGTISNFDPSGSHDTLVSGINDSGVVDGNWADSSGFQHGFVRDAEGNITAFDPPGATETGAEGINANGDIAGWYNDGHGYHAFERAADGTITTFDVPGARGTSAWAINSSGTIVGNWDDSSGNEHGFVRTSDGTVTSFDFPGSNATGAVAINDNGMIAGPYSVPGQPYLGYVRANDGTFTEIAPPNLIAVFVAPSGLDSNGDVSGSYTFVNLRGRVVRNAFVFAAGGTYTTYHAPHGAYLSDGQGMSANGLVAGYSQQNRTAVTLGYVAKPPY